MGSIKITISFVEGFGNPFAWSEARTIALEIIDSEKTCGAFLYVHKSFGNRFPGTSQMIGVLGETCGEISSKVSGAPWQDKAATVPASEATTPKATVILLVMVTM